MNEAHRGDVAHLVSCCKSGPRFVRGSSRAGWRCGRCGSNGVDLRVVVLGDDGAIPEPERDDAPVTHDQGAANTTRQVLVAGAARG